MMISRVIQIWSAVGARLGGWPSQAVLLCDFVLDRLGRLSSKHHRCLIIALACLLNGCDFPGRPDPAKRPVPPDLIVDFDFLFQRNCAGCHGADGTHGPAPPLNDAIFLSIVPDAELLGVISEGRPGTPMAAFAREHGGPLTEAQVKALAAGLKPRYKSRVEVKEPLPSYLAEDDDAGSASSADASRGAEAFARACAVCHGEHGEGTEMVGAIADAAFLGLISDQALRRLIITGRPDLGMPNFAESHARDADFQPLTSAEIDEIVALVGTWRQSPTPTGTAAKDSTKDKNHE